MKSADIKVGTEYAYGRSPSDTYRIKALVLAVEPHDRKAYSGSRDYRGHTVTATMVKVQWPSGSIEWVLPQTIGHTWEAETLRRNAKSAHEAALEAAKQAQINLAPQVKALLELAGIKGAYISEKYDTKVTLSMSAVVALAKLGADAVAATAEADCRPDCGCRS
jgi:hypothetical protein